MNTLNDISTERPPGLRNGFWAESFPWLVQGTTTRGASDTPFDLGLFSDASPAGDVIGRWEELRLVSDTPRVVHARQVHGATVRFHTSGPPGLHIAEACDGHATDAPGVLLAVTVADCVPVFVVDPGRRAVAALHAGWRGAAAGVLERGISMLAECAGSRTEDLQVHFGPSICGDCYEVGAEVFESLGQGVPEAPAPIDLRSILAQRAATLGVRSDSITISSHCTRCTGSGLFSHRAGDRQRQIGYIGLRQ